MWFLFAATFATAIAVACNKNDANIIRLQQSTFPARFRSFGGLFVDKEAFEQSVIRATGLSATCAACYGDSYICGYDHCKFSCAMAGETCTKCLIDQKCIEKCEACIKTI